jgi:N-methylhydantoinase A
MPRRSELRAAIDTGGTFTDCVWMEGGALRVRKVFSTPADPSQAIVEALRTTGAAAARCTVLHGTTVGTNALLERKGARLAFVTTAGFEDIIEIGRQARPRLYDFFFERIPPLVPAALRFGVEERTAPDGQVLRAASPAALRALVKEVAAQRPQAVAISLLFSFANPDNERAVAAALKKLGAPLSLSHEILPEFREFERASTVVVNAYLQPLMRRYLTQLDERLSGAQRPTAAHRIFVMQSSGGITSLAAAAREPVRTVLSGPAGGVVGAGAMGRRSGFDRIISFDMGGTSTDVALVDGALRTGNEGEVAGLPVRVPMLDIHTVGAGGGSIARFDAAGALRVGPESAGADPGPICYGRGAEPTVTDANLLLGRLRPDRFLGGEFTLDLERTRRLVTAWLKKHGSGLSLQHFAAGVVRVVNANMEKAIRVVSVERGYDAREFTLVAFGGAGGLHACELAAALGIPRVIVPTLPGGLSAFGILVSDVVKDYSHTLVWRVGAPPKPGFGVGGFRNALLARLRQGFAQMERAALRDFRQEHWRGRPRFLRSLDLRYRGQGFELNVPFGPRLLSDFHREHRRRYGYAHPGREVEIVTARLRALLPSPEVKFAGAPPKPGVGLGGFSPVWFDGKPLRTPIYDRDSLPPLRKFSGPAVVTEYSATTVVPPGMNFHLDRAANLVIATT